MQSPESRAAYSTLVELARHRARQQPHGKAFTFLRGGETLASHLTFGELDRAARRIAARLQREFAPGERVLLAYATGSEFIPAFFGCLYAGVVPVLAHPPGGTTEVARLARIAVHAGAAGLCTGTAGFNAAHLGRATPALQQLRCLTTTDDAEAPPPEAWTDPRVDPAALAFLQYTSGSTGAPKGVMVSHANALDNQRLMQQGLGTSRRTRAVSWLPPYHDMGLVGHVLQPLHLGIASVLMSPAAFVARPVRWLQAITDHRATVSGGPNWAYELCIRRITAEQMRTLDLARWEVAYNGSEPVRPETLERFADKFAACGFRRDAFVGCYGLAEATLFVSGSAKSAAVRAIDADALQQHRVVPATDATPHVRRVASCGRPLAQEVRVVDPRSRLPCPPGRIGEIWIRGGSVAMGYWAQAKATHAVFHARLAGSHAGPYLRTGDLGFLLDGELHVTGRLTDLVRLGERHYDPCDLEDAVRASHPALRDGATAAFAVESTGERRLVVVQEIDVRAWRRVPHAAVEHAARDALRAGFGVDVQDLRFVPQGRLPRTPSGKLRRQASREAYLKDVLSSG
ncbi:MAG TPA: fatty acyl-AMP ligase [Albitalea sp.]